MVLTALAERRLRKAIMTIRSRRDTVTFKHPFRIRGIDRLLPAGSYDVITEEEMIEGLSFAAFRRVATMISIPAETGRATEMVSIGSVDLSDAQRIDASAG
jgi:hypothetical protein